MGKGDDWSENTLEALKKSAKEENIHGIEIDIRRHRETGEVVLSHDPIAISQKYTSLIDALGYVSTQDWDVLIEFKEYSEDLFNDVKEILRESQCIHKCLLFGFKEVVCNFNWEESEVPLGIIVEYPWQIRKAVELYKPHTILLGWDERLWTKVAFKIWWSLFSLEKVARKHSIKFVSGVAESESHIHWLTRQNIDMFTVDMEKVTS